MKIYIYGIYQGAVCVYVGLSVNPAKRLEQHRNPTRGKLRDLKGLTVRTFRQTTAEDAPRLEGQVMRAFQRRGQAKRNQRDTGTAPAYVSMATSLVCFQTGDRYFSKAHAARELGVSPGTIANALELRAGHLDEETLLIPAQ